MPIIFLLLILLMSVIGLAGSMYLYRHRLHEKTVRCVVGQDCDSVLHSRYNHFRGISNETWGVVYFLLTILLTIIALNINLNMVVKLVFFFSSLLSASYGLFLINIQFRTIKHSCSWCLIPTLSSLIIFLAVLGLIFA